MSAAGHRRLRLQIEGLVQGVGFRPFVHRLASALELAGWVENTAAGVCLELEGPEAALEAFLARLPRELPPHSRLDRLQQQWLPLQASAGFRSAGSGSRWRPCGRGVRCEHGGPSPPRRSALRLRFHQWCDPDLERPDRGTA